MPLPLRKKKGARENQKSKLKGFHLYRKRNQGEKRTIVHEYMPVLFSCMLSFTIELIVYRGVDGLLKGR